MSSLNNSWRFSEKIDYIFAARYWLICYCFINIYSNLYNLVQYYVYAENLSIGKFLPARAEHEFLSLNAITTVPQIGDVVLNEFIFWVENKSTLSSYDKFIRVEFDQWSGRGVI